MREEDRQTCH